MADRDQRTSLFTSLQPLQPLQPLKSLQPLQSLQPLITLEPPESLISHGNQQSNLSADEERNHSAEINRSKGSIKDAIATLVGTPTASEHSDSFSLSDVDDESESRMQSENRNERDDKGESDDVQSDKVCEFVHHSDTLRECDEMAMTDDTKIDLNSSATSDLQVESSPKPKTPRKRKTSEEREQEIKAKLELVRIKNALQEERRREQEERLRLKAAQLEMKQKENELKRLAKEEKLLQKTVERVEKSKDLDNEPEKKKEKPSKPKTERKTSELSNEQKTEDLTEPKENKEPDTAEKTVIDLSEGSENKTPTSKTKDAKPQKAKVEPTKNAILKFFRPSVKKSEEEVISVATEQTGIRDVMNRIESALRGELLQESVSVICMKTSNSKSRPKSRWTKRIDDCDHAIKFISFHENKRPPYFGTWRKSLHSVSGRRPFAKDSQNLDYDCDSDEEWENMIDEGEVENIGDSDHEDEPEEADSEEDDFVVPDGYLSADEGDRSDEETLQTEGQGSSVASVDLAKKLMRSDSKALVGGPFCAVSDCVLSIAEDQKSKLRVDFAEAFPVEILYEMKDEVKDEKEAASRGKVEAEVPFTQDEIEKLKVFVIGSTRIMKDIIQDFHNMHTHLSKKTISQQIKAIASRRRRKNVETKEEEMVWLSVTDIKKPAAKQQKTVTVIETDTLSDKSASLDVFVSIPHCDDDDDEENHDSDRNEENDDEDRDDGDEEANEEFISQRRAGDESFATSVVDGINETHCAGEDDVMNDSADSISCLATNASMDTTHTNDPHETVQYAETSTSSAVLHEGKGNEANQEPLGDSTLL